MRLRGVEYKMRTAEDVEKIIRIANNKFPVELEDNFGKNLRKIEHNGKIYWLRQINDIMKELKNYYWISICGKVWSDYSGDFLKPSIGKNTGYFVVRPDSKNGWENSSLTPIHRFVNLLFNYNSDQE